MSESGEVESEPRVQGQRSAESNPLETSLKLFGVAGAILYGSIFLAYRSYYGHFSIVPEEVGVDYLFILVRSLAFVAMAVVVALITGVSWIVGSSAQGRTWSARRVVAGIGQLALGVTFALLVPPTMPVLVGASVLLLTSTLPIIAVGVAKIFPAQRRPIAVGTVGLVALLVPGILLVSRAQFLSSEVSVGIGIEPIELLSMPILDIEARGVSVTWIGPPEQIPKDYFDPGTQNARASGLLLGFTSREAILELKGISGGLEVVRLPTARVEIATVDEYG